MVISARSLGCAHNLAPSVDPRSLTNRAAECAKVNNGVGDLSSLLCSYRLQGGQRDSHHQDCLYVFHSPPAGAHSDSVLDCEPNTAVFLWSFVVVRTDSVTGPRFRSLYRPCSFFFGILRSMFEMQQEMEFIGYKFS